MIDIKKLLCEVCGDDAAGEPGVDLIESGLLDSLALIELFSRLEDEGIELHPTRIDRDRPRPPQRTDAPARDADKHG